MPTVTVPATTANLGPGFDCLGAALALYNQFTFTPLSNSATTAVEIQATGLDAAQLPTTADNLVYQSFTALYDQIGQVPPVVKIQIHLDIPQARGLGSSATAIIGGLLGANALAGNPLGQAKLLELAIALEGHPDNVVPAYLGGCCLAVTNTPTATICPIQWSAQVVPILAIPDFELTTAEARHVLPQTCTYGDAIANISCLGLLIKGLEAAEPTWLQVALQDKLHQPYRQSLIKGYAAVHAAARAAGAHGLVISGAGPTLLALSSPEQATSVAQQMAIAWQKEGVKAKTAVMALDGQGATVR
ncbi:MAG: homoserine kinase [Acaryochloridaceae cyanobacterium SU_2_1]|nr:homoserine kinase [Acaryochloridaceae cyanobacterium SU_2_1]NJM95650.1 homoserine kinase [Acaryochloridaceae cyanobacterium CSU_5_19]